MKDKYNQYTALYNIFAQFSDIGLTQNLQIEVKLAFIADYRRGLLVLNISDPTNLTVVANYTDTGSIYNIKLIDNIAFVSYSRAFEGDPEQKLILLNMLLGLNQQTYK